MTFITANSLTTPNESINTAQSNESTQITYQMYLNSPNVNAMLY